MKFDVHATPRQFSPHPGVSLSDMGDLYLSEDEQVTIRLAPDRGNDIVRKPWGFYLTNSLNGSLRRQALKTALVRNRSTQRLYVLLVDEHRLDDFTAYLGQFGMELVHWLDQWAEPPGP
jgi:hypothetical protein